MGVTVASKSFNGEPFQALPETWQTEEYNRLLKTILNFYNGYAECKGQTTEILYSNIEARISELFCLAHAALMQFSYVKGEETPGFLPVEMNMVTFLAAQKFSLELLKAYPDLPSGNALIHNLRGSLTPDFRSQLVMNSAKWLADLANYPGKGDFKWR